MNCHLHKSIACVAFSLTVFISFTHALSPSLSPLPPHFLTYTCKHTRIAITCAFLQAMVEGNLQPMLQTSSAVHTPPSPLASRQLDESIAEILASVMKKYMATPLKRQSKRGMYLGPSYRLGVSGYWGGARERWLNVYP